MELRDAYGLITSLIQQQNICKNQQLDMDNKIYDTRQKLNIVDVKKLTEDLDEVKADNNNLLVKAKQLSIKV